MKLQGKYKFPNWEQIFENPEIEIDFKHKVYINYQTKTADFKIDISRDFSFMLENVLIESFDIEITNHENITSLWIKIIQRLEKYKI